MNCCSVNLILQMQHTDNTTHHNSCKLNKEFKILIAENNHMYHILQCEKNDISCALHVTDLKMAMAARHVVRNCSIYKYKVMLMARTNLIPVYLHG